MFGAGAWRELPERRLLPWVCLALHALRFAAGTVCPSIARIVDQAAAQAQRDHGLGPESLSGREQLRAIGFSL